MDNEKKIEFEKRLLDFKEQRSITDYELKIMIQRYGVDVNAKNEYDERAVHIASKFGNYDFLKILIANGADINAEDKYGNNVLHVVGYYDYNNVMGIIKSILKDKNFSGVNNKNKNGNTPLHELVKDGCECIYSDNDLYEIINYLVEKGADIELKSSYGYTPLQLAASEGNLKVFEYLDYVGADYGYNYQDAFYLAIENGNINIIEYILQQRGYFSFSVGDGYNPLHIAVEKGDIEIIKLLLISGAGSDIDEPNWNRRTPLYFAERHDQDEIVNLFKIYLGR